MKTPRNKEKFIRKFYFILFVCTLQLVTISNKLSGQASITAQTGFNANPADEWYKINGTIMDQWSCCDSLDGLKFAIFDSCTQWTSIGMGVPYFDSNGAYHCQSYSTPAYDFFINSDDSTQNIISDFINTIPQNAYVLVMSHKNHFCQEWNNLLINAFRSFGSSIDTNYRIPDGNPYIIFGRKGALPSSVNETTGTSGLVQLYDSLPCNPNSVSDFNQANVSIISNPTSDNITIIVPQKATIEIININGQIIKTIKLVDKMTTIDLSNLSRGVYIACVKTENNILTKKIIKE